ncbi:hypothetical protein BJ166DRAFT_586697 [Pestalotiopsis sp. NC0098]|nr:hypothetical protein BJ166DRAFT_586697 [Pestalotiopsis sp. NC0098]
MCQSPIWPEIQHTCCGDCQSAEMDCAHVEHGAGCSDPFPRDRASSSSTPPCRPQSCVLSLNSQDTPATDLPHPTVPFNVFVKSDEALITMESTLEESIASLSGRAAARLEKAVSYLDLGGRRLREEFTLGDYNIQNDTTLYCQSRLLGGARGKGKGKATAADMLDDFSMDIDSEASEDEDYQEEDIDFEASEDEDYQEEGFDFDASADEDYQKKVFLRYIADDPDA